MGLASRSIDASILDRENDIMLDRIFTVGYLSGRESHERIEHANS